MKLDKNFIFIFIGRMLQALIAIAIIRLMTKFLSKNEIGNQYVINSIILWFSLVLINPFGMYINRHLHEWSKNHQFIVSLKKLNLYFAGIALLSFPIVFFVKDFLHVAQNQLSVSVIFLIAGSIYLSTWFQTLSSFFNLFSRQKEFVLLNIVSLLMGILFAFTLITIFSAETFFWLLGLLLGQVTSLLLALYLLKKNNYFGHLNETYMAQPLHLFNKQTFAFCFPVALATVFMWFQFQGYRLFIDRYLGAEVLAGLGVSLGIAASLASVVESLTTQYLYPKYYSTISNSNQAVRKAAWEKIWRSAISIYIPCGVVVVAVSAVLIRILTSALFHSFSNLICAGALLELFRQLTGVVYLISHSEKKTKVNILPYLFGAIILALGLFVLRKNFILNINNFVGVLILSYFVTLLFNSIVAYRLLAVQFYPLEMLRSLVISLPVLLFIPLLNDLSVMTVGLSMLLGLYTLAIIYYQLKKQTEATV